MVKNFGDYKDIILFIWVYFILLDGLLFVYNVLVLLIDLDVILCLVLKYFMCGKVYRFVKFFFCGLLIFLKEYFFVKVDFNLLYGWYIIWFSKWVVLWLELFLLENVCWICYVIRFFLNEVLVLVVVGVLRFYF